jgi:hypothetical protein
VGPHDSGQVDALQQAQLSRCVSRGDSPDVAGLQHRHPATGPCQQHRGDHARHPRADDQVVEAGPGYEFIARRQVIAVKPH